MAKFKPFHEFQKPLIGFTRKPFPHFHEDMFRLCRNGNSQRPLMQGSQTCPRENGGEVVFSLDTEGIEAKYLSSCKRGKTDSRQWNHKVYKGTECGTCQKRSLCTKSKERELLIDIREPLLQKI